MFDEIEKSVDRKGLHEMISNEYVFNMRGTISGHKDETERSHMMHPIRGYSGSMDGVRSSKDKWAIS